jgi:transposase
MANAESKTKPKRKSGRPTKLTKDAQDKIIAAMRAGAYIETAAALAGIHKDSLYEWLKRGAAQPKSEFGKFAQAVEKALAESELRDLTNILAASQTQWQASAWRLERRYPERYSLRTRVDSTHAGPDGGPVQVVSKIEIEFVDPPTENGADDGKGPSAVPE